MAKTRGPSRNLLPWRNGYEDFRTKPPSEPRGDVDPAKLKTEIERDEHRFRELARTILLRDHSLWVESGGAYGERLDLSGADLRKVNLSGAVMDEADMGDVRLWKADLRNSDQRGVQSDNSMTGRAPRRWRQMSQRTLAECQKRHLYSVES